MEKVDIYDKYKTNFHKTIKMFFFCIWVISTGKYNQHEQSIQT